MTNSVAYEIHALDLMHRDIPGSIGAWAVKTRAGCVVVESGPASTGDTLVAGLAAIGVDRRDVSAVLLTHIHLDHAGGAWQFACEGVPVYVHTVGAPHLVDPARLERSARRVYGDRYDALWGPMRPCPPDRVPAVADGDVVEAAGIAFQAVETLGHANHHHAWSVQGSGDLFTGDAVGMRVPDTDWITVPMPPPEFDLDTWMQTIDRIGAGNWQRFHLTHGGTVTEVTPHLAQLRTSLEAQCKWIAGTYSMGPEDRWAAYEAELTASAAPYRVPAALFKDHASKARLDMNFPGVDRWAAQTAR